MSEVVPPSTKFPSAPKPTGDITIRRAEFKDIDAIATIFWRSRAVAMPWLAVVHTAIEDRAWIRNVLL